MKGGASVSIADVRSLGDVLARDTTLPAGLIVHGRPRAGEDAKHKRLMAEYGALDVLGVRYPWMLMLTMLEILAEDRFTTRRVAAARSVVAPRLPGT